MRIRAAALNHLDLFVVAGLPGVTIVPPWPLGADAMRRRSTRSAPTVTTVVVAGDYVVDQSGHQRPHVRVLSATASSRSVRASAFSASTIPGTLAEYVVVPAANVRTIPPTIPPEAAAAFTLATLTAWRMLVTRARVQAGEDVLIWGIGGGVALAALQICKQIGARVWVVSASDEKLRRARRARRRRDAQPHDVDVARVDARAHGKARRGRGGRQRRQGDVDAVAARARRRGRLVTCGATSGPIVETDVRRLFWNQWSILGSTMGNDAEFDAVVGELREGRLLPTVDSVFPLEQGRAAFERLASGEQFGKVVVRVS